MTNDDFIPWQYKFTLKEMFIDIKPIEESLSSCLSMAFNEGSVDDVEAVWKFFYNLEKKEKDD